MRQSFAAGFVAGLFLFSSAVPARAASACDLNQDGVVNSTDVQLASNMASGLVPCSAAVVGVGVCNATLVQRVTVAASGGGCLVGDDNSVSLSWKTYGNAIGYNVYRSLNSSGPFVRLNPALVPVTRYTDDGVPSGQRVYYWFTVIDKRHREGTRTLIAQMDIPHAVALTWTPSISTNVVGYNIYRGTTYGGPYTKLTASPVVPTGYTEYHVPNGQMYYYTATTVDATGAESDYAVAAQAVVPTQ